MYAIRLDPKLSPGRLPCTVRIPSGVSCCRVALSSVTRDNADNPTLSSPRRILKGVESPHVELTFVPMYWAERP